LGNNITIGRTTLDDWEIFPFGEFDGKKLTKYSHGLKDHSLVDTKSPYVLPSRNHGSGTFYVGNFSLPTKGSLKDTFVRLNGFSKVRAL